MKSYLDKFFFRTNNLDYISQNIKNLTKETPAKRIFDCINSYSEQSEIRYVGGCIRKIIKKEKIDDIDLATNLKPNEVCDAFKKNNIDYYESGLAHGTITAIINKYKFEITTLRKDILTDGRHAKVEFSKDWKEDASRRDFTINSIYSDAEGNLFDPYNGKRDLENGSINFIGETNERIKEDYLRILRYLRFFLNYSKQPHKSEIVRKLRMNIDGISKLSKERLMEELKKIISLGTLEKLSNDKFSLELILIIFPELRNIKIFSKLNLNIKDLLKKKDFIFLLSLMIIDDTDNTDYFLYKFNISKKDQKRIKIIKNFFKDKITKKTFSKKNMNKLFYFEGAQAVEDILHFRIIKSRKYDKILLELCKIFKSKSVPTMPIGADTLMNKYQIPRGKELGNYLKKIEEMWVENDFQISDTQVKDIIDS